MLPIATVKAYIMLLMRGQDRGPRGQRAAGSGCRGQTQAGHGGQAGAYGTYYFMVRAMECRGLYPLPGPCHSLQRAVSCEVLLLGDGNGRGGKGYYCTSCRTERGESIRYQQKVPITPSESRAYQKDNPTLEVGPHIAQHPHNIIYILTPPPNAYTIHNKARYNKYNVGA
jgi:hypothetical protein